MEQSRKTFVFSERLADFATGMLRSCKALNQNDLTQGISDECNPAVRFAGVTSDQSKQTPNDNPCVCHSRVGALSLRAVMDFVGRAEGFLTRRDPPYVVLSHCYLSFALAI